MLVPLQSIPGGPELLVIALNLVLLLAIVGGVLYVINRVRSGSNPGERFDRVEREVGGLEARVDDLDERVTALEDLHDRVEELERTVATDEGPE